MQGAAEPGAKTDGMGRARWRRAAAGLLIGAGWVLPGSPAPAAGRQAVRSAHFVVYYERWTELPSARDASRIGEARLPEIARDLGYTPRGRIVIAVYRERRDFLQEAGVSGGGPIGVVRYPESVIYLDVSGSRLRLERVVPHELTHVIVLRLLGPRGVRKLPRWFNEGLAQYESQVWAPMEEAALTRLLDRHRAVPLDRLSDAFDGGDEQVADAYLQAWSVVRFLEAREGDDVARRILSVVKRGADFESALASETGLDVPGLDRAWRGAAAAARRELPPVVVWGLLAAYAVGAVAVVAVFAKMWIELRRRPRAPGDDHATSEETPC